MPQNLWNPFRDWNSFERCGRDWKYCHKTSETLLGIETKALTGWLFAPRTKPQNLWNPFRDWNKHTINEGQKMIASHKTSETLLGIETKSLEYLQKLQNWISPQNLWNPFRDWNTYNMLLDYSNSDGTPQNLWNPFRDWNPIFPTAICSKNISRATKPLKPF